jgi:hypothetical protein
MSPIIAHGIGLEGVLLIPLLGGAVLFGVLALPAAFLSRAAGKWVALLTLGSVALCYCFVLWAGGWDVGWLLYTLVRPDFVWYNGILLFAATVGLVAAVIPFAPSRLIGEGMLDQERKAIRRRRIVVFLLLGLPIIGLLGYGGWYWRETQLGRSKTVALLSGDAAIRFRRFEFDRGGQRRLICSDPEVLRYLEQRFREHGRGPANQFDGDGYQFTVWYADGGTDSFDSRVSTGGLSLSVPVTSDGRPSHALIWDYGPNYFTEWVAPRPPGLEEMVRFLRADEVPADNVLILDADGVRRERVPSIISQ